MKKSQRGRPKLPSKDAKGKIVPVRLDQEDVRLVMAAAALKSQAVSEWIRDTVRAEAEENMFGNTLHHAMASILLQRPSKTATTAEIADEIARAGLYRRKDGAGPPKQQIAARARKYPHLFTAVGPQMIQLISDSDSTPDSVV